MMGMIDGIAEIGLQMVEAKRERDAAEREVVSKRVSPPSRMEKKASLSRSVSVGAGLAMIVGGAGAAAEYVSADSALNSLPPNPAHQQSVDQMPSQNVVVDTREAPKPPQSKIETPKSGDKYVLFNNLTTQEQASLDKEIVEIREELKPYDVTKNLDDAIIKYDKIISEASVTFNIPKEILYAVFAIESSFNPQIVSPDGKAVGIAQFREAAAKEMGLIVDPENDIDERLIPEKAIPAAAGYLAKYRTLFGNNLGIGVGNYHMGPGNMGEAMRVYSIDEFDIDPGDNFAKIGTMISDKGLNLYRVYNNPSVKNQVLSTKEDDTTRYALKAQVVATNIAGKVNSVGR